MSAYFVLKSLKTFKTVSYKQTSVFHNEEIRIFPGTWKWKVSMADLSAVTGGNALAILILS